MGTAAGHSDHDDLDATLVALLCSTVNTDAELRREVVQRLHGTDPVAAALTLRHWTETLTGGARDGRFRAASLDSVVTVVGVAAILGTDAWADAATWLLGQLGGEPAGRSGTPDPPPL